MASETHSCEMIFQDPVKENSKQQVVFTKWKLIGLIAVNFLIFGVLLVPLYFNLRNQMDEKFDKLSVQMSEKFESLSSDIKELKTNEEIWKEKVHAKNSYANYVRVGDFGYFQKLDDKMSYEDGQAACHELHGKIIESDERNENATKKLYDVGEKLELNRKWSVSGKVDQYGTYLPSNYGSGFDVPFYIGLKHNIVVDEPGTNQWKWSSTGRMISKNALGIIGNWTINHVSTWTQRKWKTWKLISWAERANGKKLRGNCAFVTIEAKLWEIQCSTKLTIICEESFS